jgi:XRE family transcriptional regulator, aerobic/anaerobic benzoate catabolism transcriptional regulator
MAKSDRSRRGGDRPNAASLKRLGKRIREWRAQRGMTRRLLVQHSNVSERFLAQLEFGQGNPSFIVLRHIAAALGTQVEELVAEREPPSVNYRLIVQTLDRLSPDEIGEVRRILAKRFPRAPSRKERWISLIGLRGAGKTTLGKLLADQLAVPFVELNREVERHYGAKIGEILALSGQAGYLRCERQSLEKVITHYPRAVIEIGGGLATDPETLDLLLETTRTIWVRAKPGEYIQRIIDQGDLRPMSDNRDAMKDLRSILRAREPFYRKASLQLNTSGKTPSQSIRELLVLLRERVNGRRATGAFDVEGKEA